MIKVILVLTIFLPTNMDTDIIPGGAISTLQKVHKIISKSNRVEVYRVDMYPVRLSEHDSAFQYIHDYKIIEKVLPKKNLNDPIKKLFLNSNNYDTAHMKSCPFLGTYAIRFTKRKQFVALILSLSPCNKVIISSSESSLNNERMDLATNALELFIKDSIFHK